MKTDRSVLESQGRVLRPGEAQEWSEQCKSDLVRRTLLAVTELSQEKLGEIDDAALIAENAQAEVSLIRKHLNGDYENLLQSARRVRQDEEEQRAREEQAAEEAKRAAEEKAAREAKERAAREAAERAAAKAAEQARVAEADRMARMAKAAKAQKAQQAQKSARAAKFARRAAQRDPKKAQPRKVKRELNLRLAIGLSVGVAVFFGGVMALHAFQLRRTATTMLNRAESARADGDVGEAIRFYSHYVNYRPEDDQTYSTLARLVADRARDQINQRNYMRAFTMLEQAARRNPNDMEILRRLADFCMKIGRMSDAVVHLERLMQEHPNDSELQVKLGRCQMATEHYADAIASFKGVIATDPHNIEAYNELAYLLRDQADDKEMADGIMDQMVGSNPTAAKAFLLRGQYRRDNDDIEGARKDILQALKMAPDHVEVLVAAAELAIDEQDYERARGHLDRAKEMYPDDDRVHQALAILNVTEGKTDQAITHLQEAVEKKSDDARSMLSLADLQLQKGDLEAVRKTLEKMRSAGYRPEIIRYFEARILVAEGKWREAVYALERLETELGQYPQFRTQLDLLLGLCFEQLRLPDRQLDTYQRAVQNDPELPAARLGYASALFRVGKVDEAVEEYRKLERIMGTEEFLKVRALRNNLFQLLATRIARRPAPEQDWSELEEFVDSLDGIEGVDEVERTLMRAEILAKTDQRDEALDLIVSTQVGEPDNVDLWTARIKLVAMGDEPEAALPLLDKAAKQVGDSLPLLLTRAQLATRLGGEKGKRALASLARPPAKLSQNDQARFYQAVGAAWYRLRDREKAKQFWKQAAEIESQDSRIWLTLFELAREAGDEDGMTEAADAIKRLLGRRSSEWYYCEASQVVWSVQNEQQDKKALGRAKQLLDTAAQERPSWHELARLQGEIALIEGSIDQAIDSLQRANELGPLSPIFKGELVRLLYIRGRYDEAQQVMRGLGQKAVSLTMRKLEAELSLRTGDFDRALELAAETVENSDRATDFLWYGQLLARTEKTAEAERAFHKALELDPTIPEAWLARIALLVRSDKKEEAQRVMMDAQTKLPEDRIPLTMAQGYQLLGELGRAEQYYLRAVTAQPDDLSAIRRVAQFYMYINRTDKARKYLGEIFKIAGSDPDRYRDDLSWARRSLARQLAADGGYRTLQKALALLDQNAADGDPQPEDLRLKAAILATRSERQLQNQAIALFEQLQQDPDFKLSPQEQFALARLYEKTNRWQQCEELMLELLTEHAKEPSFLASYIHMLFSQHRPASAIRPWIEKLETLQPDAPATVGMKARLAVANRQDERAVKMLRDLVPDPVPRRQVNSLRSIASLMEELELTEAAEQTFRRFAEEAPGGSVVLGAFLGRQGRLDEALDQCEAAVGDVPLDAVIAAAVAALNHNRTEVTPEQIARVETLFDRVSEKNADAKSVQLQRATLSGIKGKYDEVVRLYRDFLNRDDLRDQEKAVVWNNLAFFLAVGDGDPAEALSMINEAIDVIGPSSELLDTRAMAYLANDQAAEAVADMRQAVADNPSAVKYFHLALAHERNGNSRAATQAIQTGRDNHQLTINDVPELERDDYRELVAGLGMADYADMPGKGSN